MYKNENEKNNSDVLMCMHTSIRWVESKINNGHKMRERE